MKKLLILVLAIAFAVSPAFATFTRIAGLGVNNWMVAEDDNLIWLNPARVLDYSNILWIDWTGGTPAAVILAQNSTAIATGWGGISHSLGLFNVTGAVFLGRGYGGAVGQAGNNDPAASDIATAIPGATHTGVNMAAIAPIGKYDVLLARPFPFGDIGISVSRASDMTEDSNDASATGGPALLGPVAAGTQISEEAFKSSDMGIAIGARKKDIGPLASLDAVLTLNFIKIENTDDLNQYVVTTAPATAERDLTDNKFENDNGLNMNLMLRGIIEKKKKKKIVYFNYMKQDVSNQLTLKTDANQDGDITDAGDTDVISKREQINSGMIIGAAINKDLSKKTMFILALNYASTKNTVNIETLNKNNNAGPIGKFEEYNMETKNTTIPVNLALEHIISKIVTSRIGLAKNIVNKTTIETDDPDYVLNAGATGWTAVFGGKDTDTNIDDNVGAGTVTVGLNIKPMKNIEIDALVRQQIMFTGGWLLSGIPESLATQLTATLRY